MIEQPFVTGAAAVVGAVFGAGYTLWRVQRLPPVERIHESIALTILADEAIGRLDADERAEVQAAASERMTDAFAGEAEVELEEVAEEVGE